MRLGDRVLLSITRGNRPPQRLTVTVVRIGRMYAKLDNNYLINLNTHFVLDENRAVCGSIWPNEDAHKAYRERARQWQQLREFFADNPRLPRNIHGEDISFIIAHLGIKQSPGS